jgi:hypothetical protein
MHCCFILHNLIIQIETRLEMKDTGEWARKEVDLDGEVAGDGGDYDDESRDGEDEEESAIDFYDFDSDSVAGKHHHNNLASIAQYL